MTPCPTHGRTIARAEEECEICDCRWLLANNAAESSGRTAQDLDDALARALAPNPKETP